MFGSGTDLPEKRWKRAYAGELTAVMGMYAVVLAVSILVLPRLDGAARYLVSALPVLPFSALGWVVTRSLRRVDERERALGYRAITFSFFATAAVSFGYGFLENAGAPRMSMFVVWPMMAVFWIAGRWVAPRMP